MPILMLDSIHVDYLSDINTRAGFPWMITSTPRGSWPAIPDLTLVNSMTQSMKRPDGVELDGLPVTILSQTARQIIACYIFREEDLAEDVSARSGLYYGYLKGTTSDGIGFRSRQTAVLPVTAHRFR
jgi:hypothetical protein